MIEFLPAAAGALVPLAQKVADRVIDGLPFASVLAGAGSGNAETRASSEQPSRDEILESLGRLRNLGTDHLGKLAAKELDQFMEELRTRLAGRVDASAAFGLKSDASGRVIVDGDHPRRAEIESILESDPKLTAGFHRLAAAASAHHRQQDPDDLVGRDFVLGVKDGQATIRFE